MSYSLHLCPVWAEGGSVDASFMHGEYGFNSMEWVWNLWTKSCCMSSGESNASRVFIHKFDIRYMF